MDLSIVIPAYNDIRIKECIESVDEDVERVIVLNNPSLEVERYVKSLKNKQRIKIVELPEANLAKAYNAGINATSYEKVLLMDSDCKFKPGAISLLYKGLELAPLSKGLIVHNRTNFLNSIVARARDFHISGYLNAYSPALAFHKSIVQEIGYYFDEDLRWSEDHDFDNRVRKAGLKIAYIKNAKVLHPELTPKQDLNAAFNYGLGHGVGIQKGIFKERKENSVKKIKKMKNFYKLVAEKQGHLAAIYMLIWNFSFSRGVKKQRKYNVFQVYSNKDELL
ncbi:glycosyltransferase [Priestia aryabhattai]|uniref:glycosyltransferase family 2 protein n=1 Tax=Priestia aryabhattai TaxID=412384 RepID=UPI002E1FD5A1|nr:glycosyltransferase [Priestia aryabhattai]